MKFFNIWIGLTCVMFIGSTDIFCNTDSSLLKNFSIDGKFGIGAKISVGPSHFLNIPDNSPSSYVYPMVSSRYHVTFSKFFNRVLGLETGFGINNVGFNYVFDFDQDRSTKSNRYVFRGFKQSYSIPVAVALRSHKASSWFIGVDNTFFRKQHYFLIEDYSGSKEYNVVNKRNKNVKIHLFQLFSFLF